jgi:hypothetical protein
MNVEHLLELELLVETEVLGVIQGQSARNPTRSNLGPNPGRRNGKLVTNFFSQ